MGRRNLRNSENLNEKLSYLLRRVESLESQIQSTASLLSIAPSYTATEIAIAGTFPIGSIVYITETDATFTDTGFWGQKEGAVWARLDNEGAAF